MVVHRHCPQFMRQLAVLALIAGLTLPAPALDVLTTVVGGTEDGGLGIDSGSATIAALAIASDGTLLVSAPEDGRIRRFDPVTGRFAVAVVGNGIRGALVDNAAATATATPLFAGAMTVAANGDVWFAQNDIQIAQWRRSDATVHRIAGGPARGFAGDGGPALDARCERITALARTSAGVILLADTGNHPLRRIAADGTLSTIVATGATGTGAAFSGSVAGSTYALSSVNALLLLDDNTLLMAEDDHLLRVDLAGGNTVTRDVTASYFISSLAKMPDGKVLMAVWWNTNQLLLRESSTTFSVFAGITAPGGSTTNYAGDGGPRLNARFNSPEQIAVDPAGNVFVSDRRGTAMIRRIDAGTANVSTIVGGGQANGDQQLGAYAALRIPYGIDVSNGSDVLIAEFGNSSVLKANLPPASGRTVAVAGIRGSSSGTAFGVDALTTYVSGPVSVLRRSDGSTLIGFQDGVAQVAANGIISRFAGGGSDLSNGATYATANLGYVHSLTTSPDGTLYGADADHHRIVRFSAGTVQVVAGTGTAGSSGDGGPATAAQLNSAYGITFDGAGNLYIADTRNAVVRRVRVSDGVIERVAGYRSGEVAGTATVALGTRFNDTIRAVKIDRDGNLLVGDTHQIFRIDPSSGATEVLAGSSTANAVVEGTAALATAILPAGFAEDTTGRIYFSDIVSSRVRRLDHVLPARLTATVSGSSNSFSVTLTLRGMGYVAASMTNDVSVQLRRSDGGALIGTPTNNVSAGTKTVTFSGLSSSADVATLEFTAVVTAIGGSAAGQNATIDVVRAHRLDLTNPGSKTTSSGPFALTVSDNLSAPVTITSSNASVATVSGTTVIIIGAGTVTMTATAPAFAGFGTATSSVTFDVTTADVNPPVAPPAGGGNSGGGCGFGSGLALLMLTLGFWSRRR